MPSAGDVLSSIAKELDDPGFVHTHAHLALQQLSRAQQAIAMRYELLLATRPLELTPRNPLSHLPTIFPDCRRVVAVELEGQALDPLDWMDLQFIRRDWYAHEGKPWYYYRIGVIWLGVFPVAEGTETAEVTMVRSSAALLTLSDVLEVPDGWVPLVTKLTAGILRIVGEHDYATGLALVRQALGVPSAASAGD